MLRIDEVDRFADNVVGGALRPDSRLRGMVRPATEIGAACRSNCPGAALLKVVFLAGSLFRARFGHSMGLISDDDKPIEDRLRFGTDHAGPDPVTCRVCWHCAIPTAVPALLACHEILGFVIFMNVLGGMPSRTSQYAARSPSRKRQIVSMMRRMSKITRR